MIWVRWLIVGSFLAASCYAQKASILKKVEVSGTERAELKFIVEGTANPSWQIRESAIEVNFANTEIAEELAGQTDIQSPHTLVSRIRLFPSRDGGLKVRIAINGSEQRLKDRVQLKAGSGQAILSIDYPKASDPTLSLLEEEQKPVFGAVESKKSEGAGLGWFRSLILVLVLGGAGVGAYFAAKLLRKQAHRFGSRKYLIETIAYSPVGPAGKAGVGIVKIGSEFVLVGVTANHVSLLSQLPKLQAQYEEESKVERESFQEAVKEQVREMGRAQRLRAGV